VRERAQARADTFVATFLLTLVNPPTIMIFAAMFATLCLVEAQGGTATALVVVVLAGLGLRALARAVAPLTRWAQIASPSGS
jgi:threonine/homoserine/homoserine lactone efflux protein